MARAAAVVERLAVSLAECAPRDRGDEFVILVGAGKVQASDVCMNASLVQAVLQASPGETPGAHALCQAIAKFHVENNICPMADKVDFDRWCMLQAWQLQRHPALLQPVSVTSHKAAEWPNPVSSYYRPATCPNIGS